MFSIFDKVQINISLRGSITFYWSECNQSSYPIISVKCRAIFFKRITYPDTDSGNDKNPVLSCHDIKISVLVVFYISPPTLII